MTPLDGARRALVRASAAVAAGDAGRLEEALRQALADAPPVAVEEALLQSYLFLGYPAALNALALWRDISGRPAGEGVTPPPDAWTERGAEIFGRVYGDQAEALRANVRRLHPDMEAWMVDEGYGKVLGRPGLPLTERELCIVAILAVSNAPTQLYSHLRGALAVGVPGDVVGAALEEAADFAQPAAAAAARSAWSDLVARRRTAADPTPGGRDA